MFQQFTMGSLVLFCLFAIGLTPVNVLGQETEKGDSIEASFQKAGFDLEKIEWQFEFKPESHGWLSRLSFHAGETIIPLKAKVIGSWGDRPKSKRKHQVKIDLPIRLWRLGYHRNFFSWIKKKKTEGATDEPKLKQMYWKRCKLKKIIQEQTIPVVINIPKDLGKKNSFIASLPNITLETPKKDRRQDSVFAMDVKPSKKSSTSAKGWLITYRDASYVTKSKQYRKATAFLYKWNLIDEDTANFLYQSVARLDKYEQAQFQKRLDRQNEKMKRQKESKRTDRN